jgi:hypothetical protein
VQVGVIEGVAEGVCENVGVVVGLVVDDRVDERVFVFDEDMENEDEMVVVLVGVIDIVFVGVMLKVCV